MEQITLYNGVKMPIVGYGVYQVSKEECERCVMDALDVGYRSIDTAQSYFNEEQVGTAIVKSGIPREDIFLTTKVWVEHYGYEETKKSVLESMRKLQTNYLDLVLLHQPFSDYYGAYRALEDLYDEGKLRAIGVSNFYPDRLVDIASFSRVKPMVNQVETHPFNQQIEAKDGWISMEFKWKPGHLLERDEEACLRILYLFRLLRSTRKQQHRLSYAGIFNVEWWSSQNLHIKHVWKKI